MKRLLLLLALLAAPACAGPISGYPMASQPYSGNEVVIGDQSGVTKQMTVSGIGSYTLNTQLASPGVSGNVIFTKTSGHDLWQFGSPNAASTGIYTSSYVAGGYVLGTVGSERTLAVEGYVPSTNPTNGANQEKDTLISSITTAAPNSNAAQVVAGVAVRGNAKVQAGTTGGSAWGGNFTANLLGSATGSATGVEIDTGINAAAQEQPLAYSAYNATDAIILSQSTGLLLQNVGNYPITSWLSTGIGAASGGAYYGGIFQSVQDAALLLQTPLASGAKGLMFQDSALDLYAVNWGDAILLPRSGLISHWSAVTPGVEYPLIYSDSGDVVHIGDSAGPVVVSGSAVALSFPSDIGAGVHIGGIDALEAGVEVDTFGGVPQWISRRADGTNASRSGVLANDVLAEFQARGWTSAAAYSSGAATLYSAALENFTSSHQGTAWVFTATPLASTTPQNVLSLATAGSLFSSAVQFPASTSSQAPINIPAGTAPSAPTDGDLWSTTSGVFARVNGSTQQLATTTSGVASFNTRTGPVTLSSSDVTTALTYTPANLISPTFTSVPAAPTAAAGTNTTQIATTAFVQTSYAAPPALGGTTPAAVSATSVTDTGLTASLPVCSDAGKALTSTCPTYTVVEGGTGAATFSSNLPLIGNGTGAIGQGTVSGNTTEFATVSGALTSGHCIQSDSNHNFVDAAGACGGGGGSGTVSAGTANQLAYYGGAGTTVTGLSTGNNGVLVTSGAGVPSISTTLPSSLTAPSLTVTTGFTAAGLVTLADLATQANNTVLLNASGGAASPTAYAMTTCSSAGKAVKWTTDTGFGCNSSIDAATLGSATFAAPGAIGGTTPSTGKFTTVQSTIATGTAPFTVASTTNVANLNASSLGGATFAAPGSIGSGTPGSGAFTSISASSTVSGTGFSTYLASPPAIGGTTPAAGTFTSLGATSLATINLNTAALPSPLANAVLQLGAADSQNSALEIEAFGAYANITGRRADGTNASKTAVQTNEVLIQIQGRGYQSGGAYTTGANGNIYLGATENFTPTNQGTGWTIAATPLGGTTAQAVASFQPSGIGLYANLVTAYPIIQNGGFLRPNPTTYVNVTTADPSPMPGDQLVITDASACLANVAVTAGSGTGHDCLVAYNGSAWIAVISH